MHHLFQTFFGTLIALFGLSGSPATAQQGPVGGSLLLASASPMVQKWQFAAERGTTSAQYLLGVYYARGQGGLRRDIIEAYKWFRLSASSHPKSARVLEALRKRMRPGQVALAEQRAADWLKSRGR